MCVFLSKEKKTLLAFISVESLSSHRLLYSESCWIAKVFSIMCACDRTANFFRFAMYLHLRFSLQAETMAKAKFLNNNYRKRNQRI